PPALARWGGGGRRHALVALRLTSARWHHRLCQMAEGKHGGGHAPRNPVVGTSADRGVPRGDQGRAGGRVLVRIARRTPPPEPDKDLSARRKGPRVSSFREVSTDHGLVDGRPRGGRRDQAAHPGPAQAAGPP